MATTQEILELVFKSNAEAQLASLQARFRANAEAVEQLNAEYADGLVPENEYRMASEKLFTTQLRLEHQINETGQALAAHAAQAAAAAKATAMAGEAAEQAGQKATRAAGGFNNAAMGVYQLANLMEDAQYGARGLGNNLGMLVASLGNFHPYAMAAGGALQVLTAVFKDQIDGVLDWAGILDKNLSPSAQKAKEDIEGIGKAVAGLRDVAPMMAGTADGIRRAMEAIKGGEGERAILNDLVVDNDLMRAQVDEAARQANDAGRVVAQKIKEGGFGEFMRQVGLYVMGRDAQAQADENLAKAQDDQRKAAQSNFEALVKAAAGSDEKLEELVKTLRDAGEASGDLALLEQADALEKLTERYAGAKKEADLFAIKTKENADAQKKLTEELTRQGEENERQTEKLVKELEKRVKAEQEAAELMFEARQRASGERDDRNANAFRDRLAPGIASTIFGAMGRGATAEQASGMAINQAASVMQNAGMNGMQAVTTAMKLVQEQMQWIQQQNANMDALLGLMVGQFRANTMGRRQAAAQANQIRRMTLMQNAQNVMFNNRPDGF